MGAPLEALRGRSVMISTERQLTAALALCELDGIARRMLLCTPDMSPTHVSSAITDAEIDTIVTDGGGPAKNVAHDTSLIFVGDRLKPCEGTPDRSVDTEWLLLTSGTTGRPKLAVHTLASLVGPLNDGLVVQDAPVWSTFYDIRRYGGLQILLRAFVGGGSMVLSSAGEPVADFLSRAGANRVTHISGTPSHWRRTLMSAATSRMNPRYVRLSGEACDQAILDNLRQAYPDANVAHAFASTEAGVAFDVRDGQAGFPASLIGQIGKDVSIRVEDGSLRIRSSRVADRVIGNHGRALSDAEGYVDTGDIVELRGDRYYFAGRREGVINVGGLKVHPETIEAVINQHPAVHMSRVSGRSSPITGAIAVAEVVINPSAAACGVSFAAIRNEILGLCRGRLAPHEIPVTIREISSLEIAASGKLVRRHA
ncbi:AMP-binding protein [Acidisphaera sp. S103]|uniref:AMP-binding protein n=1 Tax=Acidisphaera sp. S103 TaxID=1747223 RepID=UPI001C209B58|nr:AMP-binding protein [Acidisphaera sp. S103]